MDVKFFNIKLDVTLSNINDVIRLQEAINQSLNLNVGDVQITKKEINVIITKR